MMEDRLKQIREAMERMLAMDAVLAADCIDYIFSQLNSESFYGKINEMEFAHIVANANRGLLKTIYLKHYGRELVGKSAFAIAARNLIFLLYTRPLNGNDREILMKEFESRRPIAVQH